MTTNPYAFAQEQFALIGVDSEAAIQQLDRIPVSMYCWQGDDITGFEVRRNSEVGGGCLITGKYPGAARNPEELMADIGQTASLIPGPLRINLHAIYATDGSPLPERDELTVDNFQSWIDWAKSHHFGLDFNPTIF